MNHKRGRGDSEFYNIVNDVCDLFCNTGQTSADLARVLGVNHTTILQWKNGHNAPHSAMRPIVLRAILKLMKRYKNK